MSRQAESKKIDMARSAVTGTKLGKGARRALNKNADCIGEFLDIVQSAKNIGTMTAQLGDEALTLGRVTRSTGCGRLEVTALNIDSCAYPEKRALHPIADVGISVPICGTLKFKGASRTKTDRANCMCAGDVIVLRGGLASAKMSAAAASVVRHAFVRYGMVFPRGFFAAEAEETADDVIEWDRSEQLAAEEAEVAALRAEAARARAARSGGAGAASSDEEDEVNIDAI
jgi:hypothetical protein